MAFCPRHTRTRPSTIVFSAHSNLLLLQFQFQHYCSEYHCRFGGCAPYPTQVCQKRAGTDGAPEGLPGCGQQRGPLLLEDMPGKAQPREGISLSAPYAHLGDQHVTRHGGSGGLCAPVIYKTPGNTTIPLAHSITRSWRHLPKVTPKGSGGTGQGTLL